ncbi:hypothetical protein Q2941_44855 [Bradyrhizobium sp. UFLA05-153]
MAVSQLPPIESTPDGDHSPRDAAEVDTISMFLHTYIDNDTEDEHSSSRSDSCAVADGVLS